MTFFNYLQELKDIQTGPDAAAVTEVIATVTGSMGDITIAPDASANRKIGTAAIGFTTVTQAPEIHILAEKTAKIVLPAA